MKRASNGVPFHLYHNRGQQAHHQVDGHNNSNGIHILAC